MALENSEIKTFSGSLDSNCIRPGWNPYSLHYRLTNWLLCWL